LATPARSSQPVDRLREVCLAYPEAVEVEQFGHPWWKAGKKSFCLFGYEDGQPGVSFNMVGGRVRTALHNIRSLTVVTTYGGTRARSWLAGDPPRKLVTRMLRATIRPGARVHYHAHYDMNRSTSGSRAAFLRKVASAMGDIR
jgi:hypothetical protein